MEEFIVCLIKYTAIFICMLYAYTKLMRLKLKVWDLFDILLFAALSAALYFVTVYVKILVPIGLLIFGTVFLYLRFREKFYDTVTVSTIALGISIVLMILSFIVGFLVAPALHFIEVETVRTIVAQLIDAVAQIIGVIILFRIKRLQSGLYPKSKNATFDILLYLSVICIFTMMLLYAEEVKQYMLKVVLLVIALCGLLLIVWWRRHITFNYRESEKQKNVDRLENTIAEYESNSAENAFKVAVYGKHNHYLNKALPNCAALAERAAEQTGNADVCAVRDMLRDMSRELGITNEKCSMKNIPQTGVGVVDAPLIQLFAAAEKKNFNASADISADVGSWFTESGLIKDDIHIMLSYLLDNAVISALGSPNAKVRAELKETANKKPLIRIYDSGEQFNERVLAKLGQEEVTTRAGVGGNGIGLFTVFEILRKYGASFTLDEAPDRIGFTKCIEIDFDGRRFCLVRTYRESVAYVCAARKDVTVEIIGSDGEEKRDGTNG